MNRLQPAGAWTADLHREISDLRAEPLMCVPGLLAEFGVEPASILHRAGIAPALLEDPEQRLPFATVGRLLEEAALATGCEHFGLLTGQRAGGAVLGLAGRLAIHARTVGAGLRAMIVHFHLHDRGAVAMLATRGGREAELAYVVQQADVPGTVHILDGAIAIAHQLLQAMCGPGWHPVEVTLARRRPSDIVAYRRYFGCPVHFDSPCSAIVFDQRWLAEPMSVASGLATQSPSSMASQVRDALAAMVIGETPSAEHVARFLGTTRRTMHRRLAEEGTAFHVLLQEVRCQLACLLLTDTRMPLAEIAATLDYSEAAAFSRAFKTWTSVTPSRYRSAHGLR